MGRHRYPPFSINYFPSFTNFEKHDSARALLGHSFVHYVASEFDSHQCAKAMANHDHSDYELMRKFAGAQARGVKPQIRVFGLGPTPYWLPDGMRR